MDDEGAGRARAQRPLVRDRAARLGRARGRRREGREARPRPARARGDGERAHRRSFPHEALDEASYVAVGGLGRDGVVERIAKAVAGKPGSALPPPAIEAGPSDAVGYAALAKDLPFEHPFRAHDGLMAFAGGPQRVRSFGMRKDEAGPDVEAVARQVVVYEAPGGPPPALGEARPVVELIPKGGGDRILLSALDARATLEETWALAAQRTKEGTRIVLTEAQELRVPKIDLDATARLREIVLGAPLVGVPGSSVREALQSVRFSLDERGASVRLRRWSPSRWGCPTP